MLNINWKTDLRKFVGKAFDYAYANRMAKLMPIVGEVDSKSADYEVSGMGGYGEYSEYDGSNLVVGNQKRGFKTIVTPAEYANAIDIKYKHAKIDKSGECRKVGRRLGDAGAMTVYAHVLRMFSNAFNPKILGGDGKPWASKSHPVASKHSDGRKWEVDTEAGTFSNLIEAALDTDAITKAQALGSRFITPDGLPYSSDLDTLLVSPELEAKAKFMLGENAKLYPESDVNGANPVQGMKYIVVGGGKDGFSAKQWAICDRTLMKEIALIVYITRPTTFEGELDNPLISRHTGYIDFAVGFGDARPIIFSTGTGA